MSENVRIQPKFGKTFPEFSVTLRQRVNEYFKVNNIDTDANGWMILKSIFYISLWLGSFSIVLFVSMPFWLFLLAYMVFGFSFAAMCVNVSHDVIHGAYSKNFLVNNILKYTFDLCGASSYMWSIMHNQAHHTFTNIAHHDEDIHPVPILRLTPEAEHLPIHRFQWFTWVFIYPLATISWALSKDYVKLKQNTVANYSNRKHPKEKIIELFVFKLIYYSLFIVLPFVVIDFPWWQILVGFLLSHAVAGMYLGLIFMLAHCVEAVEFPPLDEKGFTEDSWFVHQLKTTAN